VKKNIVIATIVTFCFIGIISTFLITTTQSQIKDVPKVQTIDDNFPFVVYETSQKSNDISEERKKRNEKFDKSSWVRKAVSDDSTRVSSINHWQLGLPNLPFIKSDAVVVGVVKTNDVHLSNDKTGVYSEFSVEVDTLIKDNLNNQIILDKNIVVQRAGGQIKYPSGKIIPYVIFGQELPILHNRYVLFLTYDKQRQAYYIITGYGISNGKITALDGKGHSKQSGFGFNDYNGFEEKQFMDELQKVFYTQTNVGKEVTAP
jgi:hypothetical protein